MKGEGGEGGEGQLSAPSSSSTMSTSTSTSADSSAVPVASPSASSVHNRVLVIGSTGAGKSTLINALVGHDVMDTSSDAMGCTGYYSSVVTQHNKVEYEFIDTVGVNEPEEGTVSRSEALKLFFKFLKDNKEGFNLIIFCTREGRMTEESKSTYEIMVKKLYSSSEDGKAPPVLIFVGGMFLDYDTPQTWCEKNRAAFVKQGFIEAQKELDAFHAIALPKSKNQTLEAVFSLARAESTERAWQVIERTMAPAPVELYTHIKGLLGLFQNLWNLIAKNFGWPMIIPRVLQEIAQACGFTTREISELTDHGSLVFI